MANPISMRPQSGALPSSGVPNDPIFEGEAVHEQALQAFKEKNPNAEFRHDVGLVFKDAFELPGGRTANAQVATDRIWLDPAQHGDDPVYGAAIRKHGAGWYDSKNPTKPAPDGSALPGGALMGFDGLGRPTMKRKADGAWWSSEGTTGGARGWFNYGQDGSSSVAPDISRKGITGVIKEKSKYVGGSMKQAVTTKQGASDAGRGFVTSFAKPLIQSEALQQAAATGALQKFFSGKDLFDIGEVNKFLNLQMQQSQIKSASARGSAPAIMPTSDIGNVNAAQDPILSKVIRDGKISAKDLHAYFDAVQAQNADIADLEMHGTAGVERNMRRSLYSKTLDQYVNRFNTIAGAALKERGVNFPEGGTDAIGDIMKQAMPVAEIEAIHNDPALAELRKELKQYESALDPSMREQEFARYKNSPATWLGGFSGGIAQLLPGLKAASLVTQGVSKAAGAGAKKLAMRAVDKLAEKSTAAGLKGMAARMATGAAQRSAAAVPEVVSAGLNLTGLNLANELPGAGVRQVQGQEGAVAELLADAAKRAPALAAFGLPMGKWPARLGMRPGLPQQTLQSLTTGLTQGAISAISNAIITGQPLTREALAAEMANQVPTQLGFDVSNGLIGRRSAKLSRLALEQVGKRKANNANAPGLEILGDFEKSFGERSQIVEDLRLQRAKLLADGKEVTDPTIAAIDESIAENLDRIEAAQTYAEGTERAMRSGHIDPFGTKHRGVKTPGASPSEQKAMDEAKAAAEEKKDAEAASSEWIEAEVIPEAAQAPTAPKPAPAPVAPKPAPAAPQASMRKPSVPAQMPPPPDPGPIVRAVEASIPGQVRVIYGDGTHEIKSAKDLPEGMAIEPAPAKRPVGPSLGGARPTPKTSPKPVEQPAGRPPTVQGVSVAEQARAARAQVEDVAEPTDIQEEFMRSESFGEGTAMSPRMAEAHNKALVSAKQQNVDGDVEPAGYRFAEPERIGRGLVMSDDALVDLLAAEGHPVGQKFGLGAVESLARKLEERADAINKTKPGSREAKSLLLHAAYLRSKYEVPAGYEPKGDYTNKTEDQLQAEVTRLEAAREKAYQTNASRLESLVSDTPFETKNFRWVKSDIPAGYRDGEPVYRMVPVPKPDDSFVVRTKKVTAQEGGNQTFEVPEARFDQNVHMAKVKDVLADYYSRTKVHDTRAAYGDSLAAKRADAMIPGGMRYIGEAMRGELAEIIKKHGGFTKEAATEFAELRKAKSEAGAAKEVAPINLADIKRVELDAADSREVLNQLRELYEKQKSAESDRIAREIEDRDDFNKRLSDEGLKPSAKTASEFFRDRRRAAALSRLEGERPGDPNNQSDAIREANAQFLKGARGVALVGEGGERFADRVMESGLVVGAGPLHDARVRMDASNEGFADATLFEALKRTSFTINGKTYWGNQLERLPGYEWVNKLRSVRPSAIAAIMGAGDYAAPIVDKSGQGSDAGKASMRDVVTARANKMDLVTHTGFMNDGNAVRDTGPDAGEVAMRDRDRIEKGRTKTAEAKDRIKAPMIFDKLFDLDIIRPSDIKPGYDWFSKAKKLFNSVVENDAVLNEDGSLASLGPLGARLKRNYDNAFNEIAVPEIRQQKGYLLQLAEKLAINRAIDQTRTELEGIRSELEQAKSEAYYDGAGDYKNTRIAELEAEWNAIKKGMNAMDRRQRISVGTTLRGAQEFAKEMTPAEETVLALRELSGNKLGETLRSGIGHEFTPQDIQAALDNRHPDHLDMKDSLAEALRERTPLDEADAENVPADEEFAGSRGEAVGLPGNERISEQRKAFGVIDDKGIVAEAIADAKETYGEASTSQILDLAMRKLRKAMGVEDGESLNVAGAARDAVLEIWRNDPGMKHLVAEYQSALDSKMDAIDKLVSPNMLRQAMQETLYANQDVLDIVNSNQALKTYLAAGSVDPVQASKIFNKTVESRVKNGIITPEEARVMRQDFVDGLAALKELRNTKRELEGMQGTVRQMLRNMDPRILMNLRFESGTAPAKSGAVASYDGFRDVVKLYRTVSDFVASAAGRRAGERAKAGKPEPRGPINEMRENVQANKLGYREAALSMLHETVHFLDTYLDHPTSKNFRSTFFDARNEWLRQPGNEGLRELFRAGGEGFRIEGSARIAENGREWQAMKEALGEGLVPQPGNRYAIEVDGKTYTVAAVRDGFVDLALPADDHIYQWQSPGEFFAVVGSNLLSRSVTIEQIKQGIDLGKAGAKSTLLANMIDLTNDVSGLVSAAIPQGKTMGKPGSKIATNLDAIRGKGAGSAGVAHQEAVRRLLHDAMTESRHFNPEARKTVVGKTSRLFAGMTAEERAENSKIKMETVDYGSRAAARKLQEQDAERFGQEPVRPFGEPISHEEALIDGMRDRLSDAWEFTKAAGKAVKEGSSIEDIKKDFAHYRDEGVMKASVKALFAQINAKLVAGTGSAVNREAVAFGARQIAESTKDQMTVAELPLYGDSKNELQGVNHVDAVERTIGHDGGFTKIAKRKAIEKIKEFDRIAEAHSKNGKYEKRHWVHVEDANGTRLKMYVNDARTVAISERAGQAYEYLESRGRSKWTNLLSANEKSILDNLGKAIDQRNLAYYEELRANPYVDQLELEQILKTYGEDGKRWIPRIYGNEPSDFSGYTFGVDDGLAGITIGGRGRFKQRGFKSFAEAIQNGYIPQYDNPAHAWLEGRRQQRTVVGFNEVVRALSENGLATFATSDLMRLSEHGKDFVRIDNAPIYGKLGKLFGWASENAWMSRIEADNYNRIKREWAANKRITEEAGGSAPEFPVDAGLWIHRDAYPMFRAFFGSGLSGNKFYRRVMHLNGTLNAWQLLGPFHGTVAGGFFGGAWRIGEGLIKLASTASRAAKVALGESINDGFRAAVAQYRAAGMTPEEAKTTAYRAEAFAREAAGANARGRALQMLMLKHLERKPDDIRGDDSLNEAEKAILWLSQTSGMSPMRAVMMEQQAKLNALHAMNEFRWSDGGIADSVRRGLRFAEASVNFVESGVQRAQSAIMGGIVARTKLGLFANEAGSLLNKRYDTSKPGWSNELYRDLFESETDTFIRRNGNRLADRLDDVFGMVNWKKLGMNPKFKGFLQMIERAYGWHHGTNRTGLTMLTEALESIPVNLPGTGKKLLGTKRLSQLKQDSGLYGLDPDSPRYALRFGAGHLLSSAIVNTLLVSLGMAGMAWDGEDDILDIVRKIGYVTVGGEKHDKDSANPYFASIGYWDEIMKLPYDPMGWVHQVVLGGKSPLLSLATNSTRNLLFPDDFQSSGYTTSQQLKWTPTSDKTREEITTALSETGGEDFLELMAKRFGRVGLDTIMSPKPMSLSAADSAESPAQALLLASGLRKSDRRTRKRLAGLEE